MTLKCCGGKRKNNRKEISNKTKTKTKKKILYVMFQHNHSEINCLNPSITIIEARPLLFLNWRLIAALCLDYLCLTFHFLLSAKLHIKRNYHEHDCFHTAGVIFLLLLYISSLINSYVLLHIMDKKF